MNGVIFLLELSNISLKRIGLADQQQKGSKANEDHSKLQDNFANRF